MVQVMIPSLFQHKQMSEMSVSVFRLHPAAEKLQVIKIVVDKETTLALPTKVKRNTGCFWCENAFHYRVSCHRFHLVDCPSCAAFQRRMKTLPSVRNPVPIFQMSRLY